VALMATLTAISLAAVLGPWVIRWYVAEAEASASDLAPAEP
jgi:hypothetical protein